LAVEQVDQQELAKPQQLGPPTPACIAAGHAVTSFLGRVSTPERNSDKGLLKNAGDVLSLIEGQDATIGVPRGSSGKLHAAQPDKSWVTAGRKTGTGPEPAGEIPQRSVDAPNHQFPGKAPVALLEWVKDHLAGSNSP
jgi:hypothetical protein